MIWRQPNRLSRSLSNHNVLFNLVSLVRTLFGCGALRPATVWAQVGSGVGIERSQICWLLLISHFLCHSKAALHSEAPQQARVSSLWPLILIIQLLVLLFSDHPAFYYASSRSRIAGAGSSPALTL